MVTESQEVNQDLRETLEPGSFLGSFERYQIQKVLGRGGFAITYLAKDHALDALVAIKEFFPTQCLRKENKIFASAGWNIKDLAITMKKFKEEALHLQRFCHPGLVQLHEIHEQNGTVYIVLEYIRGVPLASFLQKSRTLQGKKLALFLQQLVQTVSYIRGAGLVHSDINPNNIMLSDDGRAVLIDFGAAINFLKKRRVANNSHQVRYATPGYAAPEQYDIQQELTPATDIYGACATLWEVVIGKRLPQHLDIDALKTYASQHPHQKLLELIIKGLEPLPKQRLSKIENLLEALPPHLANKEESTLTPRLELPWSSPRPIYSLTMDSHNCLSFLQENKLIQISQNKPPTQQALQGKQGEMMAYSESQNLIAIKEKSRHITIYARRSFKPLYTLLCDPSPLVSLHFWSSKSFLVTVHLNGLIQLRTPDKNSLKIKLSPVPITCSHLEGNLLFVGHHSGALSIVDLRNFKLVKTLHLHKRPLTSIALTHQGQRLASTGQDRLIHIYDLKKDCLLRTLKGNNSLCIHSRWLHDGKLLTLHHDGEIKIWDLSIAREVQKALPPKEKDSFLPALGDLNSPWFILHSKNKNSFLFFDLNQRPLNQESPPS